MNSKLPHFTALLFCLLVLSAGSQPSQPVIDASVTSTPAETAMPSSRQILTGARVLLSRQDSLSAKLRQQVDLFGHHLVGQGRYLQHGRGSDMRIRLELRLQTSDQVLSMLQVSDGRFLWTDRNTEGTTQIARVDLRLARRAIADTPPIAEGFPNAALPLGGLGGLLAAAEECFDFQPPELTTYRELEVYQLRGTWNAATKARFLARANNAKSLDQIGQQIPHSILLQLGRDDLFPYVVQYEALAAAGEGESTSQRVVRLEFYEVQPGAVVEGGDFVYSPGKGDFVDQTQLFIKRLKTQLKSAN